MSIANVWRCDEYALVACDTTGVAADQSSRMDIAKMLPLPHLPAVVTGRGVGGFLHVAFQCCFNIAPDFDALLVWMAEGGLGGCVAHAAGMQNQGIIHADATLAEMEVVAVGWSTSERRMIARDFRQDGAAHAFKAYPIEREPHIAL